MSGYDCLNKKNVLTVDGRWTLKFAATTSAGSVFQMCGAATAKARLPTVDRGLVYKTSYESYDYLTIMPKLRSTYDGRLVYKTPHEESRAFHRYDSLAKL